MSGRFAFTALDGPGAQAKPSKATRDRTQEPVKKKRSFSFLPKRGNKPEEKVVADDEVQTVMPLLTVINVVKDDNDYRVDDKELSVLYLCLSFTVARKLLKGRRDTQQEKSLHSPFWEDGNKGMVSITNFAHEVLYLSDTKPPKMKQFVIEKPVRLGESIVSYSEDAREFRRFCDVTFMVVLAWLRSVRGDSTLQQVVNTFLTNMLSRTGAIKLKGVDITGSTLEFGLVRPIIGRFYNPDHFVKQRQVHFNKRQGVTSAVETGVRFAASVVTLDSEKITDAVATTLTLGANLISAGNDAWKDAPVFNDMRTFLVRSRDVSRMLNTMADEVVRQQRRNELNLRKRKQQIRERFDRPETAQERMALQSEPSVASENLLHEIMDVRGRRRAPAP